MNQKPIWKRLILFFAFSQIISVICYLQMQLSNNTFNDLCSAILSAFPTNVLFWYTLVLIYKIIFKNIDKIRYVSVSLEILFYIDFMPKFGMSIFAALLFKGIIMLEKNIANIIFIVLFGIDVLIEILIVHGFYKLENSEYTEQRDRTIKVDALECTDKEYKKAKNDLLVYLLTYILPFLYCIFYGKELIDIFSYFFFCMVIQWSIYGKLKKEYRLLFEKPKFILRTFLFEIVTHLLMALACILDIAKPIAINYIVVMAIAINTYCILRVEYQIVKVIRKMEKYERRNHG